jgi:transposase
VLLPTSDKHNNTVPRNGNTTISPETALRVSRPDPQVTQRATRRRFSAADKLRILAQADACQQPGQLGALLRREGLYSSTLASFRKQRDEGKLGKDPSLVQKQRRDKEAARQRDARKIAHLQAENKKLKILLELQKKVAELLSLPSENPTDGSSW